MARRLAMASDQDLIFVRKVSEGLICSIVAIIATGFFTGLAFREFVYITLSLSYCAREIAEAQQEEQPLEDTVAASAMCAEA